MQASAAARTVVSTELGARSMPGHVSAPLTPIAASCDRTDLRSVHECGIEMMRVHTSPKPGERKLWWVVIRYPHSQTTRSLFWITGLITRSALRVQCTEVLYMVHVK